MTFNKTRRRFVRACGDSPLLAAWIATLAIAMLGLFVFAAIQSTSGRLFETLDQNQEARIKVHP